MGFRNSFAFRPLYIYRSALGQLLAFSAGMMLATMLSMGSQKGPVRTYIQANQIMRGPMNHMEVDLLDEDQNLNGPHDFEDQHKHHDNDQVAQDLYNKVRVLCWVMTCEENHRKKADHVMATWGKRCNKVLFVSDGNDTTLPVVVFDAVEKGRAHLTAKTMHAFQYSYENHMDEMDWFLKADDDSYVILENLRYFLSSQNTSDSIHFGHHFQVIVKQGYFSGGGGYLLSKEALRRFGQRNESARCRKDGGAEDAEFGKCMESLGIKAGDSRDVLGRSRFHCFDPGTFISGGYPAWYLNYDKYGAKKGIHSVSDYPITFHYIPANRMYLMEYYTYHLRPYGIQMVDEDLNGSPPEHLIADETGNSKKPMNNTVKSANISVITDHSQR